jgi:hypothetical protein
MLDDKRETSQQSQGNGGVLERLQRELAETRNAVQGEAGQLSQLQDALESVLGAARGIRLEALNQLDHLVGQMMDAVQVDANTIRERAEEEARAIRAAAEAEAAKQRAGLEQRISSAQAELERVETALSGARDALASVYRSLFEDEDESAPEAGATPSADASAKAGAETSGASLSYGAAPALQPVQERSTAPEVPPASGGASLSYGNVGALRPVTGLPSKEPQAEEADANESTAVLRPTDENLAEDASSEGSEATAVVAPVDESAGAGVPAESEERDPDAPESTEVLVSESAGQGDRDNTLEVKPVLLTTVGAAQQPAASERESAEASENLVARAEAQLRAGNVPAGLETFRTIGRFPDQAGPAITRLNGLLHDSDYDAYHDEIRQLLVDAYLAQGDYDRANLLRKLGG